MKYSSRIHSRRSHRLQNYDYAQRVAYFITICTKNRECLFGEIRDGEIKLNDTGFMVRQVWDELHQNYQGVKTDQFTIMPNHVHGIILLPVGAGPSACTDVHARHNSHAKGQPRGIAPLISLPDVVHQFKSYTTARYLFGVALLNWPPFHDKLWQHNYERIIRNEQELKRIRKYIRNNPLQWHLDKDNPSNTKP